MNKAKVRTELNSFFPEIHELILGGEQAPQIDDGKLVEARASHVRMLQVIVLIHPDNSNGFHCAVVRCRYHLGRAREGDALFGTSPQFQGCRQKLARTRVHVVLGYYERVEHLRQAKLVK
eukprot:CAMPEP_0198234552 /NCGR_PEP_ID=MMETSP1446-20131203/541_1 /TAXON_ID=1461542 ORGANISM="Unidentified sp, Strain CCMP2111" /NCGR_SAMPLE_ID=MMETSP1446 /ASSEMBLY_ACC=CAM_ASM_001112 /LENGTH=119 /DNA_ID=CAMNT_0043915349 /DNA_START=189 /DNA_END=548 /DNA_ORIENTATION=-